MASFDAQIEESQKQIAEAQARISAVTQAMEGARSKLDQGLSIDVETATLDDVTRHTDVMNANIAELIMGLDDVTAGFSKDFDEMRSKTGMESLIGFFSRAKAESMRQERLRTASIDATIAVGWCAKSSMRVAFPAATTCWRRRTPWKVAAASRIAPAGT